MLATLMVMLAIAGTATAFWPSPGGQGDQYSAVNNAMQAAAANAGISSDLFTAIYNSAITGNLSGYTASQLAAACQVLSSLAAYKSSLTDYDTVYNNLGCGAVSAAAAGPSTAAAGGVTGPLPSTGVAIALLSGMGIVGLGAASRLIKKSRR